MDTGGRVGGWGRFDGGCERAGEVGGRGEAARSALGLHERGAAKGRGARRRAPFPRNLPPPRTPVVVEHRAAQVVAPAARQLRQPRRVLDVAAEGVGAGGGGVGRRRGAAAVSRAASSAPATPHLHAPSPPARTAPKTPPPSGPAPPPVGAAVALVLVRQLARDLGDGLVHPAVAPRAGAQPRDLPGVEPPARRRDGLEVLGVGSGGVVVEGAGGCVRRVRRRHERWGKLDGSRSRWVFSGAAGASFRPPPGRAIPPGPLRPRRPAPARSRRTSRCAPGTA
jgi:hypothetical protein